MQEATVLSIAPPILFSPNSEESVYATASEIEDQQQQQQQAVSVLTEQAESSGHDGDQYQSTDIGTDEPGGYLSTSEHSGSPDPIQMGGSGATDDLPEGDDDATTPRAENVATIVAVTPPAHRSGEAALFMTPSPQPTPSAASTAKAERRARRSSGVSLPLVYRPSRLSVQAAKSVEAIAVLDVISPKDARKARGKSNMPSSSYCRLTKSRYSRQAGD